MNSSNINININNPLFPFLGDEYLLKPELQFNVPSYLNLELLQAKFNKDYSLSGSYQKEKFPDSLLQNTRVSSDYQKEKFPKKPVGGSGWLYKYTSLRTAQHGTVEYPRIKEEQRDPNNPKHWYWNYCWHKKGGNGKPLYKKGRAVAECIGCPQKKVNAVKNAIAAKLPHSQILEIIKKK